MALTFTVADLQQDDGLSRVLAAVDPIADLILRDAGKTLMVGLLLGFGKANHIVNVLMPVQRE